MRARFSHGAVRSPLAARALIVCGGALVALPSLGSAQETGTKQARVVATSAAAAAAGTSQEVPASGSRRDAVTVMIDHAKILRLPEQTQTVVIGNPSIADINIQKSGILVVTGKSYGVTNMIALDAVGGMIAESLISVQAPSESLITVQRGLERESYSCTPSCQPSALLGDSMKHFGDVSGQADQRSSTATKR